MIQLSYKNKIYLCGKISNVTAHLKELSKKFTTVKELLDYYQSELSRD